MRLYPLVAVAASVLLSAPPPADACSRPIDLAGSARADSIPHADSSPFPRDAAPLVRIGDLARAEMPEGTEPALFDLAVRPPLPVPVERETRVLGAEEWIRLFPVDPLIEGRQYRLRLMAPETDADAQDDLDWTFRPVDFIAGPSAIDEEPAAPLFFVQLVDEGPRPATPPVPCGGGSPARHNHEMSVYLDETAEPPDHTLWRFIDAEDAGPDPAQAEPRYAVEAAVILPLVDEDGPLVRWRDPAPEENSERCVIALAEDAYGRVSAEEVQCTEPVAACLAGCSSTGDRTSGGLAALALLLFAAVRARGR